MSLHSQHRTKDFVSLLTSFQNARTFASGILVPAAIALSGIAMTALPSSALSVQERYHLCSRYPHNTQCEGYEIPVPLDNRDGVEGICKLEIEQTPVEDTCKVEVTETAVNIYVETGDNIRFLDGERGTKTVRVPIDSISSLSYSVGSRVSQALRTAQVFQVLGAALQAAGGGYANTGPMHSATVQTSIVVLQFSDVSTSDVADSGSNRLSFEGDFDQGIQLREEIRSLTGLATYVAYPEESESQEAEVQEAEVQEADAQESEVQEFGIEESEEAETEN